MSRSHKPRGKYYWRSVKNKYLQSMLMSYGSDICNLRKKDRSLSRLVRKREKQRLAQEIRDGFYE